MAKIVKKTKTTAVKKKTASLKKTPAKKPVKAAKKTETDSTVASSDRRALAARARQLKSELLAIRFNIQSPSLIDYRKKKRELASVLADLG